ncbi:MAG: tetratricopeptide repeat protein, partial [Myxococcota bacterium]
MKTSSRRPAALLALLLASLPAGLSAFAARDFNEDLSNVDFELQEVEEQVERLSLDFTQRRGLIGAAEARQRYEDAVYTYLVGEYEAAASTFFALVESEALVSEALDLDSEWYLSECLFEMGNYASALDAYQHIVDTGPQHPFFVDAVRRQLEVYGIQRDNDAFQALYRQYVLSGIVEPNDQIKYTVGKSFYRRGAEGYARAKGMFTEIAPDSPYYSRARYFMGTILSAQGDFDAAIAEFTKSAEATPNTAATREVQELAWLALGRLYYEVGRYDKSIEYYQNLDSTSPYFADQLYELAWTYIKQESWADALQAIEIFLIAFPEHRYTMQLQLTQGHLHMKEETFEKALVSYETVVDDYTPVREQLARLEGERESAARIFAQMSEDEAFDDSLALPSYAVEMLIEGPEVARAVEVNAQLAQQRQDLTDTQSLIEEVELALAGSTGSIGTFSRGRTGLQRVREQSLSLRADVVGLELAYLLQAAPERYRPEIRELRERYLLLKGTAEDLQGSESAGVDRYEAHLDQVREVQSVAFQVQQVTADLRAEATALRNQLKSTSLPSDEAQVARQLLADVEAELEAASERLQQLQSESVQSRVMRSVPRAVNDENAEQWELLARDYNELHRQLNTYWSRTNTPERDAIFGQVIGLWSRLATVEEIAGRTDARLDSVEREELSLLRQRLIEER